MENTHWQQVRDYILSIAWIHPDKGVFTTVMTVVDIFMHKPAQKVLSISCFQPKHDNKICVLECAGMTDVYPRPVWRSCDSFMQRSLIYDNKPQGGNNAS